MQNLIAKAATLLEALPYIQRFRSQTFVVKYGGSFMDSPDPAVRDNVVRNLVFLEAVGINPVVVHGGGKAITARWKRRVCRPDSSRASASRTRRRWTWWSACCRAKSIPASSRPSANWAARRGIFRRGHFPMPQAVAGRPGKARRETRHRFRGRSDVAQYRTAARVHPAQHHPVISPRRWTSTAGFTIATPTWPPRRPPSRSKPGGSCS